MATHQGHGRLAFFATLLAASSSPAAAGGAAAGSSALLGGNNTRPYKYGAIYFGDWHVDPVMEALHGTNWTEWNLVVKATPRFPNHLQPNLPLDNVTGFGPSHPENVPANMEVKIDAATKAGFDFFLFDWCVRVICVALVLRAL
jgi:hypothetical protein